MEKDEHKNPIDKDKIAENPHVLPYAHHAGSLPIDPIDKGKVKGKAMAAMYEQTEVQLTQIREQIELLIAQAQEIQNRKRISEKIYLAEMNFEPLIGGTYYLYRRTSGIFILLLVGPREWGQSCPLEYIATVKMFSDHTWELLEGEVKNEE